MTDIARINGTTTIDELLRMGARITFGSGRSMTGDVRGGYIAVANEFGGLGVWDLDDKNGVEQAVHDLARDAAESGMTLHGKEIPEEGEETIDEDEDEIA